MDYAEVKVGVSIVFKKLHPCKVIQVNVSAPGKHGHAKKACVGIDYLTGKKHEEILTHHSHITPVTVSRTTYMAVDVDADGFLTLIDDDANERQDLKLPAGVEMADELVVLKLTWGEGEVREKVEAR